MVFESKADFRVARERCGVSQKMLADHFGNAVLTVKRWEKPGEYDPPEDVREYLAGLLEQHVKAVETVLDAVEDVAEKQGRLPDHVDLLYYRSQAHYDRYGRDKGDYRLVNARAREVAAVLESQGIEARFRYPEDSEGEFQALANTR